MKKRLLAGLTGVLLLIGALFALAACKTVENVAVDTGNMPQSIYVLGNDLDLSKGGITADGTRIPLNAKGVTVTGYDKNTLGEQTLTVTYEGKTTTYVVTVVPRFRTAEQYVYFVGEQFSDAQPRINITRDDGSVISTNGFDNALTVSGFDSSKPQDLTLNAVYEQNGERFEGTFSVSVVEPQISFTQPRKRAYESHETELNMVGASLRLLSPDGKTTRNVSYSQLTTSGFDPSAATKDNPSVTQTIAVSYRGMKMAEYSVEITYSDVSRFQDAAEALSALDWDCYRFATEEEPGMAYPEGVTQEQKELAIEMMQLYCGLKTADANYITQEQFDAVARLAVVYAYNEWMDTVNAAFANAFEIDEVGDLIYLCDTREEAAAAAQKLLDENDEQMQILRTLGGLLNNDIFLTKSETTVIYDTVIDGVPVDLTAAALASIIPDTAFMNDIAEVLEWSQDALDALAALVPEDWTQEDIAALERADVNDVYMTLMEINENDAGNASLYPLLNGWREKEDVFEILYRFYYFDIMENEYSQSLTNIDNLSSLMFPLPLEKLRVVFSYGQVAQQLMQSYRTSFDPTSGDFPELLDSTLFLYLYEEATQLAEELLLLNDEMYTELFTLYYAPILSEMLTGECGYYDLRGASSYDADVQEIWDLYFDLWLQYSEDASYADSDEFGTNVRAMFEKFVALMPNQQLCMIQSINYLYGEKFPEFALYPYNGYLCSDFSAFLYAYYLGELGIDISSEDTNTAYDVFTGLLLALEYYANGDIDNFCNTMTDTQASYEGEWVGTDKAKFDSYLSFFYDAYMTRFARFAATQTEEGTVWDYKEVDLGEAMTTFEALADAIDGTSLAKTYIDDLSDFMEPIDLYLPFLASYERVRELSAALMAGSDPVREAYYFMPYGESTYREPLYYGVYTADGAYIRYLMTLGIDQTQYEQATALRTFLKNYADYFWTIVRASGIPYIGEEFDFTDGEAVAAMLSDFRALSAEEQLLLLSMDTLNLFHGGIEAAAQQIIFKDNTSMQQLVTSLLNVQIAYIAYRNTPDGTITDDDGNTTTLLAELLRLWEDASGRYAALGEDAMFQTFRTYFGAMYDFYAERCAALGDNA